jgi:hypothetical protein
MIYPTFHKICVEYDEANLEMKFASLKAVAKCRYRKEISEEQYITVSQQIELFFRQNKILFDLDGSSPRSYEEIV